MNLSEKHAALSEALDRTAGDELTEAEARRYFDANFPEPQPRETQHAAIHRLLMEDVARARELIPELNAISARRALEMIEEGSLSPGAIFKARHDQAWLLAESIKGEA